MADQKLVDDILDALYFPGTSRARRPVHTVGIGVTGWFEPSPVARNYCEAEHFTSKEPVKVTMRFSNGLGYPETHDGWSDVRGMAVRFHPEHGKATDLISMTLPVFFSPDAETFLAFAKAARPVPCKRESAWQKLKDYLALRLPMPDPHPGQSERPDEPATAFADAHGWAQPAVLDTSQIGAPVSYVRAAYHAVHAFIVHGDDKVERWVRFSWQPVAGVMNTNMLNTDPPLAPARLEYLQDDMRRRLKDGTERFTLVMAIGEVGDDFDDPTRQWPLHRRRIIMGELTLTSVPEDQQTFGERLSFNPWLLPEKGMRASADKVLAIRRQAYETSSKGRGAIPCPFSGAASETGARP